MQLLIILALLLYGGKSNAANIISEVKPVLESLGGEEMREALKSAEEISSVLSAVQSFAGTANTVSNSGLAEQFSSHSERSEESYKNGDNTEGFFAGAQNDNAVNFPLAPISAIADKDITYSLSKYIAQNA